MAPRASGTLVKWLLRSVSMNIATRFYYGIIEPPKYLFSVHYGAFLEPIKQRSHRRLVLA